MSDLVDPRKIEGIVGRKRHPVLHFGFCERSRGIFYILHSIACVERVPDLRDCPFSVALDVYGIDPDDWPPTSVALDIDPDGSLIWRGYTNG